MALSFWPANFGKQPESIQQFETLIQQQQHLPPSNDHAQSHFFLGNLYQQTGRPDMALAAWKRGLDLFPGNEQLAAQIASDGRALSTRTTSPRPPGRPSRFAHPPRTARAASAPTDPVSGRGLASRERTSATTTGGQKSARARTCA